MSETPLYLNPDAEFAARVEDLLHRMTVKEKVSQMLFRSPAIPRLSVPAYAWWNEGIHGVGRAGRATVFPQSIALAATWNETLMLKIAGAIGDEGRAKNNAARKLNSEHLCVGLTYWSPNINIFRDPRWGRGQETYGEDPYLTSRMGVAYVRGIQGNDPKYWKLAACAKHYAVHSGPEALRHSFDARTNQRDLWDTYLPAFEAAVVEAGVAAVMGAYNRTNGLPCCAHPQLMGEILRGKWKFAGHYVSDCGAVEDFHTGHRVTSSHEESAAAAVNAGCDLCCGKVYESLLKAIDEGLVSEEQINVSVRRLLDCRMRLGMFDPPERVPYTSIPETVLDSPKHRALALQAARESIVLLKNEGGILPIKQDIKKIALIGPLAASTEALLGNYSGLNPRLVTVLEGIVGKIHAGTVVTYTHGCEIKDNPRIDPLSPDFPHVPFPLIDSDIVIACMGLTSQVEGEENDAYFSDNLGDRKSIGLPEVQQQLLEFVYNLGKPVVLVLVSGSAVAIPWAQANIPAILQVLYPGEEGGTAVADVLFGGYNPAGRLPFTVPISEDQLPPFEDYSMAERTYRYMESKPLYPFGYGLSYTSFQYSGASASAARLRPGRPVTVQVTVRNTGQVSGDEVVQVYVRDVEASVPVPKHALKAFRRVHLQAGETKLVKFKLGYESFSTVDEVGNRRVEAGEFEVFIGGGQPGFAPCERLTIVASGSKAGA